MAAACNAKRWRMGKQIEGGIWSCLWQIEIALSAKNDVVLDLPGEVTLAVKVYQNGRGLKERML